MDEVNTICIKHRKYKGARPPSSDCLECWKIYFRVLMKKEKRMCDSSCSCKGSCNDKC